MIEQDFTKKSFRNVKTQYRKVRASKSKNKANLKSDSHNSQEEEQKDTKRLFMGGGKHRDAYDPKANFDKMKTLLRVVQ